MSQTEKDHWRSLLLNPQAFCGTTQMIIRMSECSLLGSRTYHTDEKQNFVL